MSVSVYICVCMFEYLCVCVCVCVYVSMWGKNMTLQILNQRIKGWSFLHLIGIYVPFHHAQYKSKRTLHLDERKSHFLSRTERAKDMQAVISYEIPFGGGRI